MLGDLAHQLLLAERAAQEGVQEARWGPLTAVMTVISFAWLKTPLYTVVAGIADFRARRLPVAAVAVLVSGLIGEAVSAQIKHVVGRRRPPLVDHDIVALVHLPRTSSFPSGHATTAFAAATALALLCPRLRLPAFALAALIAFSRVYLGVHFPSDVITGAALGTLIGAATAWLVTRLARAVPSRARGPG